VRTSILPIELEIMSGEEKELQRSKFSLLREGEGK
jgi:hypothetical protein